MATQVSQVFTNAEGEPYVNYIANVMKEDKVTPAILYSDPDATVLKSITGKVSLGTSAYLDVYLPPGSYYMWLTSPRGVQDYSRVLTVTNTGYNLTDNSGNVTGGDSAGPIVPSPSPSPSPSAVIDEGLIEDILNDLPPATSLPEPGFLVRQSDNWTNATKTQVQNWLDIDGAEGVKSLEYPFFWGDASPREVFVLPANRLVYGVEVTITTPFDDPLSSISLGDLSDTQSLLKEQEAFTGEIGSYRVDPSLKYTTDTSVLLSINPQGSTQGSGIVVITYQR